MRVAPRVCSKFLHSRPFFNVLFGRGRGFFIALLLHTQITDDAVASGFGLVICKEVLPQVHLLKEIFTMASSSTTQTSTVTSNALDLALQKVASVDVPQGKTITLAYSGGLDSTLCVKLAE